MADKNSKVDLSRVRKLYRDNRVFAAAMDEFAVREKFFWRTRVERIQSLVAKADVSASRRDVIELFRTLEELGCGKFKVGRKSHPSRFEWSIDNRTLGRAASGESEEVIPVDPSTGQDEEGDTATIEHRFQLRPDFAAVLLLPVNLAQPEAQRLAKFIEALPF